MFLGTIEETMTIKSVPAVCGEGGLREPQFPLLASSGSVFI